MKKLILFILLILIGGNMQAQSYDNYLHTAINLLNDGNIDAAKRAYEIYKQLSDKSDSTFEELLDKAKKEQSWMDACNIVDLGNGNFIAVQKDDSKITLKYDEAKQRCESNRLGGFCDWRLPSEVELSIIFSTINWSNHNYYWTSFHTKSEEGSKGSDFYLCKDNWMAINPQGEK